MEKDLCKLRLQCSEVHLFLADVAGVEGGYEVVDGDAHGGGE